MSIDPTPNDQARDRANDVPAPSTGSARSKLLVVAIAGVAVVAIVAVAVWYFLIRADTPEELALDEDVQGSGEVVEDDALTGTWTVVAGSGAEATVAGYRVDEQFAGGIDHTAAARTDQVTGSLTVDGSTVTEGSITVDMTTLASVDDRPDTGRRDNAMRSRGLQTDTFPEASFALTEPIELPEIVDGEVVTVPATGDLTIRDATNPVTIDLQVRAIGDTFTVQGQIPILLADYGIDPPSVSGFVTVGDDGTVEFLVNFERG